ncbi:MAG: amidohydrolase family protein [Candidatus Kariarchaeaceae archaeon]|jgi:predicted TIM-barrel fold metal-dependent hydrolase
MELKEYIDCHLHFHSPDMTNEVIKDMILAEIPSMSNFFDNPEDNSPLLGLLDALNCKRAWIINYESPDVMGYTLETNDWVADFCSNSNNRLIPIGSVNPALHEDAGDLLRDYYESGMIRGIKIHGPHQLIRPNAYIDGLDSQKKLYSVIEDYQIPAIFHTGTSIFPNARSKFGNPMMLEDVLIDYPQMTIIMAHGGRPFWTREAEFLMAKFSDQELYMDLSGIPPHFIGDYFPRFERYAHRCIFGSDYPSPGVQSSRQNAESIASLPLPDETLKQILFKNAEKLIPV